MISAESKMPYGTSWPSLKAALFKVSFRWCLGAFATRSNSRRRADSA